MDPAAAAQLESHQNPHQFTDTHSKELLTTTLKSPQASKAAHASSSLSPCCVCVTAPNTLATPHSSAVPELVPFPFNPPSSLSSSTALCQACYCTVHQYSLRRVTRLEVQLHSLSIRSKRVISWHQGPPNHTFRYVPFRPLPRITILTAS